MLAARYPATQRQISITNLADEFSATERAIRPEAVALAIFAALAAVITLAIISQLLSRQMILDAAEYPILHSLGMTRARLFTLSMARVALATIAGGAVAAGVAVAASPLMPIGAARLAEPSPGVEVNLAVLAAAPLALVAAVAWRAASRARDAAASWMRRSSPSCGPWA